MAENIKNTLTTPANISGWMVQFDFPKFPLEKNKLFETYTDALNYAKGPDSYIGNVISILNDQVIGEGTAAITYPAGVYVVTGIGATNGAVTQVGKETNLSNYYTKQEVNNIVTGLFKFKGSDSGEAIILKTNAEPGDVWNSTTTIELNNIIYPVGTNVVWVMDENTKEGYWDAFGGLYDLSGYLTKPDYSVVDEGKVLTVVNEEGKLTHKWQNLPDSAIYWIEGAE